MRQRPRLVSPERIAKTVKAVSETRRIHGVQLQPDGAVLILLAPCEDAPSPVVNEWDEIVIQTKMM